MKTILDEMRNSSIHKLASDVYVLLKSDMYALLKAFIHFSSFEPKCVKRIHHHGTVMIAI